MNTILRYPGAKWSIARWICAHLPPHDVYVELYFGSGAVFFRKTPSNTETINDIDGLVVNLFRVLRDNPIELARVIDLTPWSRQEYMSILGSAGNPLILSGNPIEDARRFIIRCWQSHGCRTSDRGGWSHDRTGTVRKPKIWSTLPDRILSLSERLKQAQIEQKPALELINMYKRTNALIYADPPYLISTRRGRMYNYEMNDSDHMNLLEALDNHPGPVLLSGYACKLYDDRLQHWERKTCQAKAEKGQSRIEVLWLNPVAARSLGSLFDFMTV